jgi:hypothetical protein
MNKLNILLATLMILPATASAEEPVSKPEVRIKFPIVRDQSPDLQNTVKTPTVVWLPQAGSTANQKHIISPLFYYQESTEKNK